MTSYLKYMSLGMVLLCALEHFRREIRIKNG